MKNILSIIQDLQKESQFLLIQKKKGNYFLSSVNDSILKYSQDWQTECIDINSDYIKQLKDEIDITELISDFHKYFMNLILKLTRQSQTLKMLITNLIRIEDKSKYDHNLEHYTKEQINFYNNALSEEQMVEKSPQEYTTFDKFQNIINNYQNLVLLLIEQDNTQILFKNPLSIDFNTFKQIQFNQLCLTYKYVNFDSTSLDFEEKQTHYETKLQWLLEIEKYSLSVNYLKLNIGVQSISECEGDDTTVKNVELPDIQSDFIRIFANVDGCVVWRVVLKFAFSEFKKYQKQRVIVQTNAKYLGHAFYCYFDQLKQIPSILNRAQVFVNSPLDPKKDLNELFLEDQYLLIFLAFQKKKIDVILTNSIAQVLTDLFMD